MSNKAKREYLEAIRNRYFSQSGAFASVSKNEKQKILDDPSIDGLYQLSVQ